jgi:hypothetical protein
MFRFVIYKECQHPLAMEDMAVAQRVLLHLCSGALTCSQSQRGHQLLTIYLFPYFSLPSLSFFPSPQLPSPLIHSFWKLLELEQVIGWLEKEMLMSNIRCPVFFLMVNVKSLMGRISFCECSKLLFSHFLPIILYRCPLSPSTWEGENIHSSKLIVLLTCSSCRDF